MYKGTLARGQITFSDLQIIQEKSEIAAAWYAINGSALADTVGETGSYYITKQFAAKYSLRTGRAIYTFNNVSYTFAGGTIVYTFPGLGTSALDTAYVALREFLRASGLFDGSDSFTEVFDWETYSELLAVYYAAEHAILEAVEETQDESIDQVEYLSNAFADYGTVITGGLILGHFIGVKNSSNAVKAALNGDNVLAGWSNATHGTIMFAAGITSLGDSSNEAAASTKIYEDGTLVANKLIATGATISGSITATGGTIGGFHIGEIDMYAGSGGNYVEFNTDPTAGQDQFILAGGSDLSTAPFYVKKDGSIKATAGMIGGFKINSDYLGIGSESLEVTSLTSLWQGCVYVSSRVSGSGAGSKYNTVSLDPRDNGSGGGIITINTITSGTVNDKVAIAVNSGTFKGLRPYTQVNSTSATMTLNSTAYNHVLNYNNDVTVTTPTGSQIIIGDTHYVFQIQNVTTTYKAGSGQSILYKGATYPSTSSGLALSGRGVGVLVYYQADTWLLTWHLTT